MEGSAEQGLPSMGHLAHWRVRSSSLIAARSRSDPQGASGPFFISLEAHRTIRKTMKARRRRKLTISRTDAAALRPWVASACSCSDQKRPLVQVQLVTASAPLRQLDAPPCKCSWSTFISACGGVPSGLLM